jgi:outer membrane protein assembly factor BamD
MRNFFLFILIVSGLLIGCNDFNKLQKKGSLEEKYNKAVEYYNKKDYTKAQMLFDELYSVMRGTDKAENVAYYLAYTDYNMGDYIMAGYIFKTFFRTYPVSSRAAECLYMSAYCHYLISPPYTLDQEDTYSAIEEFQYFIQMFPTDTARIHECNKMVDLLHTKLEKKAYYNSKLYFDIEDYKASIAAFEQFLKDFPDTHYREDATYYIAIARYRLAVNSIDSKKEERVNDAINACKLFMTAYKESEYTDEVKATLDKAEKLLKKIEDDKKASTNQNQ